LGSGRGQLSSLCASYDIPTIAVDSQQSPQWQFEEAFLYHKNIIFRHQRIEDFLQKNSENFDLIFLMNVITFFKKDVFLSEILLQILDTLTPG
jgi:chemotaxis methyl-accepting protein methylase